VAACHLGRCALSMRCACETYVDPVTCVVIPHSSGMTTCGVSTAILISTNLLLQVDLIPSVRHTTRHQTLTIRPGPRQDEVAEVLDAFGAESVGLGVGGDVLLEDEVLRGVKSVHWPVFGFDCAGESVS
jgi:hypothetical protein